MTEKVVSEAKSRYEEESYKAVAVERLVRALQTIRKDVRKEVLDEAVKRVFGEQS